MSYQPNTILARWPGANQSSAVPIIARTITNNLGGIGAGRRAVQIRPFRLQGPSAKLYAGPGEKDDGRNMFVLRSLSTSELMTVFVEDPSAPTRLERKQQAAAASGGKGKEKEDKMMVEDGDATAPLRATDNDDEDDDDDEPGHTRWTYCSLGVANAVTPLVTPFDAFLQRVLLGSGGQAANSSNPSTSWIPRSTAVSLEGFVFHLGGAGGVGDWEIKVGSVMVKGGASGGTSRGVLVEVSSLALLIPLCQTMNTYRRPLYTLAGNISRRPVPSRRFNNPSRLCQDLVPRSSCQLGRNRMVTSRLRGVVRSWVG